MEIKLINISNYKKNGANYYSFEYIVDMQPYYIELGRRSWNRSEIVNALIRSIYPQDRVEAVINNHFLNISEWLDKKFDGSQEPFIDEEYDKLQEWRSVCKQWADEALVKYPVK